MTTAEAAAELAIRHTGTRLHAPDTDVQTVLDALFQDAQSPATGDRPGTKGHR